ncbi:family 16 glycosylhydrolase [Catenovulum adriaticum]|uniref:Family 16 glycosylhydrolase n=1 Tax=Catenovulum adriaticum TaxID=2984846 RepID=A0ABY7ASC1_9ALTE|nr:family 16 glycosylhydrolase [Catenovulum sp. TS8]WAJ72427.1 family 16 glycosylhydrolase [Catenovulum sp. TS8]
MVKKKWTYMLLGITCLIGPIVAQANFTPQLDGTGNWIKNQKNWQFNSAVSDEFNQAGNWQTPDTNKWNRYHPTGWLGNNSFTYNGNLAYTHNGNLVLEARNGANVGDKHSTGIASSKASFKYGYFEVKAKAANNNIASSFWFFNRNANNGHQFEIDVYEHFPYQGWNSHKKMKSNIHYFIWSQETGNVDQIPNYESPVDMPNNGVVTDWHVYGVLRDESSIRFYVDGVNARTIWKSQVAPEHWPGDKSMPVILDILVYDWQQGANEPSQNYSFYYVDYFRVWN